MSDRPELESPPSSPKAQQLHSNPDVIRDVVLWRKKQLNIIILLASTATWVAMELYQKSFITLFSWVAMAVVTCFFFWGNIHRLIKKGAQLSELEISEETAREHANSIRKWAEEGVRLVFHVGAEREWFVFAGVVAFLYLMSLLASRFHFLTLLYLGVVGVMTIPAIYIKNENKFAEFGEQVRTRSQKVCSMAKQKFQEMKNMIGMQRKEVKEKKQD